MVTRLTETGETVSDGAQIEIGGNDKYVFAGRTGKK